MNGLLFLAVWTPPPRVPFQINKPPGRPLCPGTRAHRHVRPWLWQNPPSTKEHP